MRYTPPMPNGAAMIVTTAVPVIAAEPRNRIAARPARLHLHAPLAVVVETIARYQGMIAFTTASAIS